MWMISSGDPDQKLADLGLLCFPKVVYNFENVMPTLSNVLEFYWAIRQKCFCVFFWCGFGNVLHLKATLHYVCKRNRSCFIG